MIFIRTLLLIQRDKISPISMGSSLSKIFYQHMLNGIIFSLILPFFRCLSPLLSIFQSRNVFSWWTKKKQAVEDVDLKNRVWLQNTLNRMNDVFTVVFFIEMVIKTELRCLYASFNKCINIQSLTKNENSNIARKGFLFNCR